MTKKWPVLLVIITLAMTQWMCAFGSTDNSPQQLTAVAGDVQKTVDSIKKTANPTQLVFPTVDQAAQNALQTVGPVEKTPTTQPIPLTQSTGGAQPGSIGGQLSYPSEFVPNLTIVAFQEENGIMTGKLYLVDTQKNQMTYQIQALPAGRYFVVAYLRKGTLPGINGLAAGYTKYILCGATAACTDHGLVEVQVFAGTMTGDINPQDWYAPANSFPSEPPK